MEDLARTFAHDGFVVLHDALPPESLESVRAAALRIVDGFNFDEHRSVFRTDDRDRGRDEAFFASATGVHCFLEKGAVDGDGSLAVDPRQAVNKIGHALHDLVPEFTRLCREPLFGELVRAIGMTDPLLWQTMYIFKQPRIGGEVRWHQDASYLISRPASVVGIWIAVEDAHVGNGCLWMQRGGHRSPLRERYEVDWSQRRGELRAVDETPWPAPEEATPLEVDAGSVVLFHDHMPHYSSHNASDSSRHAFSIHVAERRSEWSRENWLQRDGLAPFAL